MRPNREQDASRRQELWSLIVAIGMLWAALYSLGRDGAGTFNREPASATRVTQNAASAADFITPTKRPSPTLTP